jgi:carboxyl-terminal processing protease
LNTNPPRKRDFLPFLLVLGSLGLAFFTGFMARVWIGGPSLRYPLLEQVIRLIQDNGLNDLPPRLPLEYGLIRGFLQAYNDPYAVFLEPPQAELQNDQLEGRYGGIGARLERDAQGNVLLYPYPDSPAARAGILEGSRLLHVDSLAIDPGMDLSAVEAALRGPVGQQVSLTVDQTPDHSPQEFTVTRAEVSQPSTTWNLAAAGPRVGVIHVNVLAATTPQEIQSAVADLRKRGADHFILDLRGNGGGLVEAGVDTARLFLTEGTIIQQQYRGKPIETFQVEKPGPLADLPIVVLVDKDTASAAEIVAGALQVHRRALLVGQPTHGKDTIQLVFDLKDGSSLHVTAARWWIPGLDPPIRDGHGLQPDIPIPTDADSDGAWLNAAMEVLIQ